MTSNYEDKGRQHRDWHLALLFIPLLSLSFAASWAWRSLADSPVIATVPQPPPATSPQPLVGGERVAPSPAAEKLVLASWQDAQPFLLTKSTTSSDSAAARTKRLVEFLTALTDLRERTQRVLEAELGEPSDQRGVALAALATPWDALKTADKFQELVDLSQWSAARAQLWQARAAVAVEIERARMAAQNGKFVACSQHLQTVNEQLQPFRATADFEQVFGELTTGLEELAARARVLAAFQTNHGALPTDPEKREPLLKELVNRHAADQPDGRELDQHAGPEGRALVVQADLELAHLRTDLLFGSRPGTPNAVPGNSASLPVGERLALAKKVRDRYQQYPEISERLRQLALSWLQQVLVERSLPLQQLDPAFQEAVNVETNGLAIGLFISDANSPTIWNYWRSSAERVKNPDKPEHRLTTQREIEDVGLKRIAEPPRPLFLVSSIGDFNLSIQGLRAPENLNSRGEWEEHVRRCKVWELEAAALRNRVANFGLKGGGVQTEQAQIEKAYLEMSFDAEWKQAQAVMAVFTSVESLLGTSSGNNR